MLSIKDVCFSFGHQEIFNGLTFELKRGNYLVISGSDRAGKTTLVKMLTAMILPDSGEILIDGEFLDEIARSKTRIRKLRQKIGGVGGVFSLLNDRTILENVSLSAEICGIPARKARKYAVEACCKFRLSHVMSYYPDAVSKVEQRMALLARAAAARKELIIADAPTDGLDESAAGFINERLQALRLSGISILYLTTGPGPQSGPDEYLHLKAGRVDK
ncbi:MAG: ATP-binding cassette domain-containing protein [Candidatus Zixiibacteriota bacterium]